jgi:uncharacterized protein (TIGR00251 family)
LSSANSADWGAAVLREEGGIVLWLRLTPKGGRDAMEGVEALADGRAVIKARVRAAPEDGRANQALIELIAKALRVPRGSVSIVSGHTARIKKLSIAGDCARLIDALAKTLAPNHG